MHLSQTRVVTVRTRTRTRIRTLWTRTQFPMSWNQLLCRTSFRIATGGFADTANSRQNSDTRLRIFDGGDYGCSRFKCFAYFFQMAGF